MLTSYQSLFLQFVEESWERELQGSVEPEEISEIINKRKEMLTPSVGEPFVFFEWFYNKGYELYIKYYQKHLPHIVYGPFLKEAALDESNLKWKITTIPSEEESQVEEEEIEYSVDLTGLFNEELNKIKADE